MILVTGANGFIGKALLSHFSNSSQAVRALVRKKDDDISRLVDDIIEADLEQACDSATLFHKVDTVIHLAARTHILKDSAKDPLQQYRQINTHSTLALARNAAKQKVKRFIFLSSIKVNGETSPANRPFQPDDEYIPDDPYGLSKYETEKALHEVSAKTGLEVVIIRPPLVYGPGVKGNFLSLLGWLKKGIPLPLGAIHNRRSLVALDNLVDFILLCADRNRSSKAANEVFLISDGEDVSTSELLRRAVRSYKVKSRLLPIPVSLMKLATKILGKSKISDRLFGDLQVDSSKAKNLLGWEPVIGMNEQLGKMAECDQKEN